MDTDFNTFYYTDSTIQDKRTLSLLSIMCDTVYLHYMPPDYYFIPWKERWEAEKELPIFKTCPVEISIITTKYCNDYSQFIEENTDLIDAGIINPIQTKLKPPDWENLEQYDKQFWKDYAGLKFGELGLKAGLVPTDKVYIDFPYFSIYRFQSNCASLYFALKSQITPISDNPFLSSLAQDVVSGYSDLEVKYTQEDFSKILAFKTLSATLPNFGHLTCDQIFEIREYLEDELINFRYEMCSIANEFYDNSESIDNKNMDNIINFKLKPRLDDLKLRIEELKSNFKNNALKNVLGAGIAISTQCVGINVQATAFAGFVGKMLIDYSNYHNSYKHILSDSKNRGLSLLLHLNKEFCR
jgi:hypothetical protein